MPPSVESDIHRSKFAKIDGFREELNPSYGLLCRNRRQLEHSPVFRCLGNVALRLLGFVVLIPQLGVLGAAIACSASLVAMTLVLNVLCRQRTGLDPSVFILLRRFGSGKLAAQAPAE